MIEIIPAMDIIGGKCVRLEQGDFARRKVYDAEPVDAARGFGDAGLTRLHMVDLDGARCGVPQNLRTLERVANSVSATIDYGGGIRTAEDVRDVLSAGAAKANLGSLAVKRPECFARLVDEFGPDVFLPGADARNGMAAVDGWATDTDTKVADLLQWFSSLGIKEAFVTDVGKDGMLLGPAVSYYRELRSVVDIDLIASGGTRSIGDLVDLEAAGCRAVIIGKALYEGLISLTEVAGYVSKADRAVP